MTDDYGNTVGGSALAPEKAAVPMPILKKAGAINLYYIAVGALAIVVVLIPILSIWVALPDQILGGWSICIGGLIALIGQQGATQNSGKVAQ